MARPTHLPAAEVRQSTSTAEAAAQVARGEVDAAVSAPLAGAEHGLEALADDVADNAGAVTRFALVTPPGPLPAPTGHDRTTFAATTQNRPGTLLGLLTELAVRGIDLTRIESRPIKDRHAEYWFHIDCTGHITEPAMGEALAALHRRCDRVRFLGSYPRAGNGTAGSPASAVALGTTDAEVVHGCPGVAGLDAGRDRGMTAPTRLIMVRHGQTDANVRHTLDSRPPGSPLNDLGHAQAAALGGRLASEPVTAVYASRAIRAQQTAAPVAVAHDLPVSVVDGVQEVFCGDLEGRSDLAAREQFDLVYASWWRGDLDAHLPGGESAHELRDRYLPVLRRIADAATGTVVLVSHGAAIRLAAAAVLGDTAETTYVPNAGVVILGVDGAGWALEHWDSAPPVVGDVTAGGAPG